MSDSIVNGTIESIEKELQELEHSYAECLADDVDRATLRMLWLQIKALKRELLSRSSATK